MGCKNSKDVPQEPEKIVPFKLTPEQEKYKQELCADHNRKEIYD